MREVNKSTKYLKFDIDDRNLFDLISNINKIQIYINKKI